MDFFITWNIAVFPRPGWGTSPFWEVALQDLQHVIRSILSIAVNFRFIRFLTILFNFNTFCEIYFDKYVLFVELISVTTL